MRRPLALAVALASTATPAGVLCATAAARAPHVGMMIVGRTGPVFGPRSVRAAATSVSLSRKRCAIPSATPLAALAGAHRVGGPSFRVRDYGGSCSRHAADAGSLFVYQVGRARNRGRDGWTYKVGNRAGSTGAADLSGPFGRGRMRSGAHVVWFWCRMSSRGSCQRTLTVSPSRRRVAPGGRLRVVVRGYDDFGHGVRIGGATVRLGRRLVRADAHGVAVARAPSRPGWLRLTASRKGLVTAYGERIRVG